MNNNNCNQPLRLRLQDTRQIFMRLHGTTLSGYVLDRQSVQVFNLLRNCSGTGQIFVRYRVNSNRDEYLHGYVTDSCLKLYVTRHFNEDPSNTSSHPKTAEQRPKEFILVQ